MPDEGSGGVLLGFAGEADISTSVIFHVHSVKALGDGHFMKDGLFRDGGRSLLLGLLDAHGEALDKGALGMRAALWGRWICPEGNQGPSVCSGDEKREGACCF